MDPKNKNTSSIIGIAGTLLFVTPTIVYYSIKLWGNQQTKKNIEGFPIDFFIGLSILFILLVALETFKNKLAYPRK